MLRCIVIGACAIQFQEDRGAPLFIDDEFTGVLMAPEDDDSPSAFEKLFFHLDFLEDILKGTIKNEIPNKKQDTKVHHVKQTP